MGELNSVEPRSTRRARDEPQQCQGVWSVSLRSVGIRRRGPPVTAARRQPGSKPGGCTRSFPRGAATARRGQRDGAFQSHLCHALHGSAPQAAGSTAGKLPFCGGRVTGALSPAARPRRRGAPSRRTPLRCRTGGCGPGVPPQCPSVPNPRKGAGEGRGSRSTGGDGRAQRRGAPPARGSAYRALPPSRRRVRRCSGGTEGRGRYRAPRPSPPGTCRG